MLFDILFIADWKKIGEHRQRLTDLNAAHENKGRIDYDYKVTFRLGGQIEFGIIYIQTQLNTTVYVGITTTKTPKKTGKKMTFPSPPLTHPPAPPPNITAVILLS